jgi:integrase
MREAKPIEPEASAVTKRMPRRPHPKGFVLERRRDGHGNQYFRARLTLCDGKQVAMGPRFATPEQANTYGHAKAQEVRARRVTSDMVSVGLATAGREQVITDSVARPGSPQPSEDTEEALDGEGDRQCQGRRNGTVQKFVSAAGVPYWRVRVSLCDGTRRYCGPRFPTEEAARAHARRATHTIVENGITLAMVSPRARNATGETCDEYFTRLSETRKSEGVTTTHQSLCTWLKWVSPFIGEIPVRAVERDDIERIRERLDEQVRLRITRGLRNGICGGRARAVWTILRTTFKEAVSSRHKSLRLRSDDPTAGHKPPLTTQSRTKTFLYPIELLQLVASEAVPLEWRRLYAIATYTYARPEELQALMWADVDFTARRISINKSMNGRTCEPKPLTKTAAGVRDIPIEPTLLPLLKAMYDERASEGAPLLPILRIVTDGYRATTIRTHLTKAGITRPRLSMDTPTARPVDFRSCRDTGITWLSLKGLPLHAVQRRCGHNSIMTTNGYVKAAEDFTGGAIGEPFPPLPAALLTRLSPVETLSK